MSNVSFGLVSFRFDVGKGKLVVTCLMASGNQKASQKSMLRIFQCGK